MLLKSSVIVHLGSQTRGRDKGFLMRECRWEEVDIEGSKNSRDCFGHTSLPRSFVSSLSTPQRSSWSPYTATRRDYMAIDATVFALSNFPKKWLTRKKSLGLGS